jgi:hypothetical protein
MRNETAYQSFDRKYIGFSNEQQLTFIWHLVIGGEVVTAV